MKPSICLAACLACYVVSMPLAYANRTSPAQETQAIKSLTPDVVQGLQSGKPLEFAKAAQLNGYVSPQEVMQRDATLGLSNEQKSRIEALLRTAQSKAVELGLRLLDEERKLNRLFADKTANVATLSPITKRIGELHGQLYQAHLESHIAVTEILTPAQLAKLTGASPNRNRVRQ